MVDAIGGVPICIPENYCSPDAGLNVAAGYQTLDGPTALAVRPRAQGHQHERLGPAASRAPAAAHRGDGPGQVLSKNVLTNVPALMSFLDAATSSLTVDPGLSQLTDMAGLALSLRNLKPANISFMTVPVATAPSDPNRVVWTSAADELWVRMVLDQPVTTPTAAATAGATGASATTTSTPGTSTGAAASSAPATDSSGSTSTSTPSSTPTVDPIPGLDVSSAETSNVCG